MTRERFAFPDAENVLCRLAFSAREIDSKRGGRISSEAKQSPEICLGEIKAVKC